MDASVVVPTRNRSRLLALTLRSVLGQAEVGIEVIVVDEASTDDTAEVVGSFEDPRVRLIHNATPTGPNGARNRGATEARGEWLAFVDDDDLWAPTKLARQIGSATEIGLEWVYAGAVNVDDRLRIIHGVPAPEPARAVAALPRYNPIPAGASNVVVRRQVFEALGGFNEDERIVPCEDWDLWLRLARTEMPARVPSPLVAYRMHRTNSILDVAAIIEGARTFERLHGTTIDWGRFHRWLAQLSVRGGDRRRALREYARAAVAGQGRESAAEVATLARGAIGRRLGMPPTRRRHDPGWEEEARDWIKDLRRFQIPAQTDEQR